MPYDLIVLNRKWFQENKCPEKVRLLSEMVNKGYSKPMERYKIIKSPRIKHPSTLLECLRVESEDNSFVLNDEDDFWILLVLGSKSDFKRLEANFGYRRHFNRELTSSSNDSDIPKEFTAQFGPLTQDNTTIQKFSPTQQLLDEYADRLVATLCVKPKYDDSYFSQEDLLSSVKHYEITGFTSFLRGKGTELLDFIASEFATGSSGIFPKPENLEKIFIHAVAVIEYDLVSYYTDVCNYTRWNHPDELIKASQFRALGLLTNGDFNLAFLRKEIQVKLSV